jgi:hypothetical protein
MNGNSEKRHSCSIAWIDTSGCCKTIPRPPLWRLDGLERGDSSRTQVPLEGRMLRKPSRDLLVRYAHQVDVMSIPHRYNLTGRMGTLETFCLGSAPFISAGGRTQTRVHYIQRWTVTFCASTDRLMKECSLLGCDAVWSGRGLPTFRRELLPPSSGLENRPCNLRNDSRFLRTELNSVGLVRKRTIPTERPPLVGEVSANFCG